MINIPLTNSRLRLIRCCINIIHGIWNFMRQRNKHSGRRVCYHSVQLRIPRPRVLFSREGLNIYLQHASFLFKAVQSFWYSRQRRVALSFFTPAWMLIPPCHSAQNIWYRPNKSFQKCQRPKHRLNSNWPHIPLRTSYRDENAQTVQHSLHHTIGDSCSPCSFMSSSWCRCPCLHHCRGSGLEFHLHIQFYLVCQDEKVVYVWVKQLIHLVDS